jgi:hypothetical protein
MDLKPESSKAAPKTFDIEQGDRDDSTTLTISVSRATHPYLVDHSIGDKPVVPMALALEWLARGARILHPNLSVIGFRNLQVLRGIQLSHFTEQGKRFTVACRYSKSDPKLLITELLGENNALHYRATAEAGSNPVPSTRIAESNEAVQIDPWRKEQIYDGYGLFHGPLFQMIRVVTGISTQGAVGEIVGIEHLGWQKEDWIVDVALLDGGLQLAGLWAEQVLGGATLPMAFRSYKQYYDELPKEIIRCVVRGREVHQSGVISDIEFVDPEGLLVAALHGVESYLRPDEKLARPKNQSLHSAAV